MAENVMVRLEVPYEKIKSGISFDIEDVFEFYDGRVKTEVENLSLLPSGNIPPNPSELLLTEKLEELISELENILKFYEYAKKMNIYNKVRKKATIFC